MGNWIFGRCGRLVVLGASLCFGLAVWTFWYAMNSDRDDISPLLTQLIPAGHCACKTSTNFECATCLVPPEPAYNSSTPEEWIYDYGRDAKQEGFDERQCLSAFPGLVEDIGHASNYWTQHGPITSEHLDQFKLANSVTRAMIYQGSLYIIASKSKAEDHRRKAVAVLSSIHRALSAAPDRVNLPNIEFMFSIEDKAADIAGDGHPLWVLTRKATEKSLWLMPDFGFWAWDNIIGDKNNEIGPYDEIVQKVMDSEINLPFHSKQEKLVWRGKLSFAPKLRRALLDQSRDHEWNDVKELNWNVRNNYLTLEDHCKYQYIAHVEGRSYSASLKYRQACNSVILIHKLQYIQHHHYLLVKDGPLQNYVEVERDFSDLSSKMEYFLDHPEKAQKVAENSVKTFRERYLTPAAEACYWRALWKGYGIASEPAQLFRIDDDGRKIKKGLRYETFVLLSSTEMLDFAAE